MSGQSSKINGTVSDDIEVEEVQVSGDLNLSRDIKLDQFDILNDDVPSYIQRLFDGLEEQHPQLGLAWLQNLMRHSGTQGEVGRIYIARHREDDFVALPLILTSDRAARSLGNFYTSLSTLAVSGKTPQPLLLALFRHLREVERVNSIILSPLEKENPLFPVLLSTLSASGWAGIHEFFCFGNWVESIENASWESYLEDRPSKLRNTIERKSRAFLKDSKGQFAIIQGGTELTTGIEQYTRIYENSWKNNEPHPAFMPHLIRLAAEKNWLRLGVASYEGTAIAAQVWLVVNGTAYIFKLAYHQDFSRLSAGTLLTAHLMQHVIEQDRVKMVDYLSGDDSYKKDWMSLRRERFGIAAYNANSLQGLLELTQYKLISMAKKLGLH